MTNQIIYYEIIEQRGQPVYRWTWPEGMQADVFGIAENLSELARRTERLFPGSRIVLTLL